MSMPQAKLGDAWRSPLILGFAGLLLSTHLYFENQYPNFVNPNIASRLYTTLAIIDDGTFAIDGPLERYPNIQDKAEHGGHFYSDKGPGLSLALAPIAWLLRQTAIPIEDDRAMLTWLRVLGISLPLVGFWIWLLPRFETLGLRREVAAAVLLSGALGTSFFVHATGLFAHSVAGALLFVSWWVTRQPAESDSRLEAQRNRPLIAGLLAGFAFTVDFIVMPAVALLFFLGIARDRGLRRRSVFFGVGVAIALVAWMAHNQVCFGNPLRVGFHLHSDPTYGALYRQGFLGIHPPRLDALLGLTLSPARGLFFLSPALALAIPGWLRLARDSETRDDAVATSLVFLTVLFFATTTIEWRGGWSMGARYLVPAIPFMLVGVAGFLRNREEASSAPLVFATLAGVGVGGVALSAASFSSFPYPFANPVYNFALRLLRHGYHTDGAFFPFSLQDFAVILFAGLALGGAVYIAWNALGPSERRPLTALGVCIAAILLMVAQATIPESAANLRERDATAAEVIRMMGY